MMSWRWIQTAAALVVMAFSGVLAAQTDPAARLMAEAERKVAAGDVGGAVQDWQSVIAQFADSESATEARIAVAETFLERQDWTAAADYGRAVLDTAAQSPAAARAYVVLGETALNSGREAASEAAESFARAWDLFPAGRGIEARAAGRVREGEVRLRLGQPAAAEKAFLDVIETQSIGAWTSRAYRGLVQARIARGEWSAAIEALQEGMSRMSRVSEQEPNVRGDLAAMQQLAAAAHRAYLRSEGRPMWSEASRISGLELKRPVSVQASDDGSLTIVDRGLDVVLMRESDGSVKRQAWSEATRPFDTWDGRVWIPVRQTLQSPGEVSRGFGEADPYKGIAAGAGSPFGAYLLTTRPDAVVEVSPEMKVVNTVQLPPRSEIVDLDSDATGAVVLLDRRNGAVLKATDSGMETLVSGLDKPIALSVGPFDHLYVLERGEKISVFSPAGERLASVGPTLPGGLTLRGAEDLDVDRSGRLWIADSKEATVFQLGGDL